MAKDSTRLQADQIAEYEADFLKRIVAAQSACNSLAEVNSKMVNLKSKVDNDSTLVAGAKSSFSVDIDKVQKAIDKLVNSNDFTTIISFIP